jgi:hypothetical protein
MTNLSCLHYIVATVLVVIVLCPPRVQYSIEKGKIIRKDFQGLKFMGYKTTTIKESRSIPFHMDFGGKHSTLNIEDHRILTFSRFLLAMEIILILILWLACIRIFQYRTIKNKTCIRTHQFVAPDQATRRPGG